MSKNNKNVSANQEDQAEEASGLQRLQRVLASAGLGSRRECEELIVEGRVEVDGKVADQLGTKVDPDTQKILVDGERLKIQRFQYFAVNKPPGVVSTNSDPSGRTRVVDLIKSEFRVYNVGRLDMSSEGLILVTNDGDLANRLTHPKFGIEKTYQVQTVGVPQPEQLTQLEKGVFLAEGKAKAKSVKLLKRNRQGAILEIVLEEGKNREIRRLLARVGHKVTRLQRVAIGPLEIGGLPVGQYRDLTLEEVRALKAWRPKKSPKGTTKTNHPKTTKQKTRSKGANSTGRNSAGRSSANQGDESRTKAKGKPFETKSRNSSGLKRTETARAEGKTRPETKRVGTKKTSSPSSRFKSKNSAPKTGARKPKR